MTQTAIEEFNKLKKNFIALYLFHFRLKTSTGLFGDGVEWLPMKPAPPVTRTLDMAPIVPEFGFKHIALPKNLSLRIVHL